MPLNTMSFGFEVSRPRKRPVEPLGGEFDLETLLKTKKARVNGGYVDRKDAFKLPGGAGRSGEKSRHFSVNLKRSRNDITGEIEEPTTTWKSFNASNSRQSSPEPKRTRIGEDTVSMLDFDIPENSSEKLALTLFNRKMKQRRAREYPTERDDHTWMNVLSSKKCETPVNIRRMVDRTPAPKSTAMVLWKPSSFRMSTPDDIMEID